MWKPIKSEEEIINIFDNDINPYIKNYDSYMGEYIRNNFLDLLGSSQIYSELTQLYCEYKFMSDEDNYYISHLNNIMNNFDIGCNILEIAAGSIPTLSNLLAATQLKLGKGTVTVYEPSLVIDKTKYNNMTLYKKNFYSYIDISKFDLVISIMPCRATDEVLDAVFNQSKDFYISFCGCVEAEGMMGIYDMFFPRLKPTYQKIIPIAKKRCRDAGLGELVVEYLDPKFEVEHPIIYNKKIKK